MIPTNNSPQKNLVVLESFELEYGKVLEDIPVEYSTSGVPKYDGEGNITNAIVFCQTREREFSILQGSHKYLKSKGNFNIDDFFFITISSFGVPGSFSPSTSGLKSDFPQYSIRDMVNFKRQFLMENFKIKKIFGIIGEENGGYEAYAWACEYPDDMKFIMLFNSDYKISGYRFVISKGLEAIIESNEDYYSNPYSTSLTNVMVAVNTIMYAQFFSEKTLNNLANYEIEALLDDFVDEGLSFDIYDLNFRNNAFLNYDNTDKLANIKAKTLVIYSDDSIYFNQPVDENVLMDNISDLKILSYDSQKENYYDWEDYSLIGEEVISFLNECFDIE